MADTTLGFDLDAGADTCPVCARPITVHHADRCLLEALREGSDRAYEALIRQYQQPVYNLVYRLMDDPADAADVVQEVFLKVFRNVGAFRGDSSLKTWIYRISCNEAYNHRRWFTRHKKHEIGLETDAEGTPNWTDVLSDRTRSAFDIASEHEMHSLIENALIDLNPQFRAAVVLRDIEDLSYEEIADVLGISLGTVKSRILRGREALRKALADRLRPEAVLHLNPEPAR